LDPDKYVRERGSEGLQKEIDGAIRYDQLFLQNLGQNHDLKSATGRLAASEELILLLNSVSNPFERDQLMNRFASTAGFPPQVLHDLYRSRQKSSGVVAKTKVQETKIEDAEKGLLQTFLLDPSIALQVLGEFDAQDFDEMSRADLFRQFAQLVSTEANLNAPEIIHSFPTEAQNFMSSLVLDKSAPLPTIDYARDCLRKLRRKRMERNIRQLDQQIEEASKQADQSRLDQLLMRKLELTKATKM
jgi:DNA primase